MRVKSFTLFCLVFSKLSFAFYIKDGIPDVEGKLDNVFKLNFSTKAKHPNCTGTIISDRTILTAAHCTDLIVSTDGLKMTLNDQFEYEVEDIKVPDEYYPLQSRYANLNLRSINYQFAGILTEDQEILKKETEEGLTYLHKEMAKYDIALIIVKKKFKRRHKRTDLSFVNPKLETKVIATGYGNIEVKGHSIVPKYVHCREALINYNEEYIGLNADVNKINDMITTGGDSGGPLLLPNKKQMGVLRGILSVLDEETNRYVWQSIYTPLTNHRNFILNNQK